MKKKKEKKFRITTGSLAGHVVKGPFLADQRVREEVLRLRDARQHSVAEMASLLGLTPNLVHLVLRKNSDPLSRKQRMLAEQEEFPGFTSEKLEHCPGCGYEVRMPCLVCWLSRHPQRPEARLVLDYADATDSLDYDLASDEQERLDLIRQKRMAVGEPIDDFLQNRVIGT